MTEKKQRPDKTKKKRNRLIFRSVILAILVVAVGYALISNLTEDNAKVAKGDDAPDFKLNQVNDSNNLQSVQLSDLKGKGVMLNFWATYCDPCKAEMPYMEKLYPKYKERGVEIVAVSLDATQLVIDKFINKYDLTFPVLHDTKNQVLDQYGVEPLPSTFFINPDGKVEEVVEGALTLDTLEDHLKKIEPK
ncbi:thiol-disulfide oxidoreductase ResA [Lentibacillus sp. L22]|uniref:thiol-disulfide oxidoreductase ResA n=1 Tax=Lentibacillus TaxID=175304 RepID=UPI0022B1DBA2|nr:thiol-disulfide oxidoreductase ResA [Lentibacillus daqui]